MNYSLQYKVYQRPFQDALETARGPWHTREGIVLRLEDAQGKVGFGEVAPIEDFGTESLADAEAFLKSLQGMWDGKIRGKLPCCAFGLGCAEGWINDRFSTEATTLETAALLPAGDAICSSLTKSFSGVGDVTGGSIVVNPDSRFADRLTDALDASPPAGLYAADVVTLERNSRDYTERLPVTCENAVRLVSFLREQPGVAAVYYPDDQNPVGDPNHASRYDAFSRPGGGRGPLFSLLLEQPAETTATFYDALAVDKGPNLGTNYTLACPFTILAHYHELDWAESCGVSRYLIRVSTGLEPYEQLQSAFAAALDPVS